MEIVKEIQKDLFAALSKPLLEVDNTQTRVRKGRASTTTTHAELNLFALGMAALGIGVTAWVMGLGLAPVTTTKQVWHPNPGGKGNPGYYTTESKLGLTIVERPRMLLPFTGSSGAGTTANLGIPLDILGFFGFHPLPGLAGT